VPGVSTISADVHKYGYCVKGASVLVHRDEDRRLDPKRVGPFLKSVHAIWRNPVRLRGNGKVYTYDRKGLSTT